MSQQHTMVPHVLKKKLDGSSNFFYKNSSEKYIAPHPGAPNLEKKIRHQFAGLLPWGYMEISAKLQTTIPEKVYL